MEYLTLQNRRCEGDTVPDEGFISAAGKHVVIIGGGDTGADCLGTVHRQGARSVHQFELLPRPPEGRATGNPWPEWPNVFRVSSAHEEGGERVYSVSTQRFTGDAEGRVAQLHAIQVDMVREGGRLDFRPVAGSEFTLDADLVLLAMGFVGAERPGMLADLGVTLTDRGNVGRDGNWMTSVPGVFTCGDMQRGQSLIVWAIAEGRSCARGVDHHLMGTSDLPAPLPDADCGPLPRRARTADRSVRGRAGPAARRVRGRARAHQAVAPVPDGMVGPRGRLSLRRLREQRLPAHPVPRRRTGAAHRGLRRGRLGADSRLSCPSRRDGAGHGGGGAREHRAAPAGAVGRGLGQGGPPHGVRDATRPRTGCASTPSISRIHARQIEQNLATWQSRLASGEPRSRDRVRRMRASPRSRGDDAIAFADPERGGDAALSASGSARARGPRRRGPGSGCTGRSGPSCAWPARGGTAGAGRDPRGR